MSLNLTIAAIIFGGWLFSRLFSRLKLPNILGMVGFGILIGILAGNRIPDTLWDIEPMLKSLALIVILLRAGLGLSKATLKKAGRVAVLMTIVPCVFEGAALTVLFHLFFNFDWYVSGLTAFMIAAVSPAVIVPTMLDLKERGYGERNEVPSIILAGASADDVLAITFFSVFLGLATSGDVDLAGAVLSIPLSIFAGIVPGVILGLILVQYFPPQFPESPGHRENPGSPDRSHVSDTARRQTEQCGPAGSDDCRIRPSGRGRRSRP